MVYVCPFCQIFSPNKLLLFHFFLTFISLLTFFTFSLLFCQLLRVKFPAVSSFPLLFLFSSDFCFVSLEVMLLSTYKVKLLSSW